jgi:hypothetical protein
MTVYKNLSLAFNGAHYHINKNRVMRNRSNETKAFNSLKLIKNFPMNVYEVVFFLN